MSTIIVFFHTLFVSNNVISRRQVSLWSAGAQCITNTSGPRETHAISQMCLEFIDSVSPNTNSAAKESRSPWPTSPEKLQQRKRDFLISENFTKVPYHTLHYGEGRERRKHSDDRNDNGHFGRKARLSYQWHVRSVCL